LILICKFLLPRYIQRYACEVLQKLDDQTLAKMVEFSIKKYVCEDFKVDYIQRPALFSWDPYDD